MCVSHCVMKTLIRLFTAIRTLGLAACLCASAAFQAVASEEFEKVIGDNDFIPVNADASNLPVGIQSAVDAVGQLNIGCTATHIGSGLVLTAGHCVTRSPRSRGGACPQLGVIWGNYGGNKKYSVSKCITIEAREYNERVDYAVLRVTNPPKAAIEVDWLPQDQNGSIAILSFPRMRPMEWSAGCETQTYHDPARAMVKFSHTCDTEGGSSGAPIFSADTFKLIGIHGGAGDELNYAMFVSVIARLVDDIHQRHK